MRNLLTYPQTKTPLSEVQTCTLQYPCVLFLKVFIFQDGVVHFIVFT